jgi:hypothetical protein
MKSFLTAKRRKRLHGRL